MTNEACMRGHTGGRYKSGACIECAKQRARSWKENNKQRSQDWSKAYYLANAEKKKAEAKTWASANKEVVLARVTKWAKENPERRLEIARRWAETHREQLRAAERKARLANPAGELARVRKRQAAQAQRLPKWADLVAIREIYEECRRVSETTGVTHHVDHFYPLRGKSVSGLHVHQNLRIIPAQVNLSKSWKMPEEEVCAA